MIYNEKYDRYVTNCGLVYRYDSKQDKLILCKLSKNRDGYLLIRVSKPESKVIFVHRLVFETFIRKINQGYVIDHINTVRDDNRVDNLRVVTQSENNKNPLTRQHYSDTRIKKSTSDFGKKYFEHFGYSCAKNKKQYKREQKWYYSHNRVCRWEMKTNESN